MKRFVINIASFFSPVFVIILFMFVFYWISLNIGELKSIEENIQVQIDNSQTLIGLGYNEQTQFYKLECANYYEAEVLALGTSRVMQFKADFFNKDFYNCGGAVGGNYSEYVNFLNNLEYKPDIILVGLDAWVFNDAWNKDCAEYNEFYKIQKIDRDTGIMLKSIVTDWLSGKWEINNIDLYPANIGFNGCIKDTGFMQDGSYYYGYIYRSPETAPDFQFVDTMDRISKGIKRFEWGEHIDQDTIDQLEGLLEYCRENNINIVGFLTPFAPKVYNKMDESGNYGYLNEIGPACRTLFTKYGFEFYDYMNGTNLGVTDDYFVDGFHGSEVVYACILEDMIENDSYIEEYVDQKKIDELRKNAYSTLVFENPDE